MSREMTKKEFLDRWDELLILNLFDVYTLDDLTQIVGAQVKISQSIENIFNLLKNLKNKRFYSAKEIETIYLLAREDIVNINELLYNMCGVEMVKIIYSIIVSIFDDLIDLSDAIDNYECSGNLLKFRDYWFNINKIKIKHEQK